jgi:hypothetical protein
MWSEGKCMQLEDIMLSEVSQVQKDKGPMFSLICGRQIQMINMYTKTSMIIYKLTVELLNGTRGKERKEKKMIESQQY